MRIHLVSIGPGDPTYMTPDAFHALQQADVVIGYHGYLSTLDNLLRAEQQRIGFDLGAEIERARHAIRLAQAGQSVALVSSGDVGVYGMAGTLFEVLAEMEWDGVTPEVVVHPGVSAMFAAAARVGAPLAHDFCAISLSDLLTPWEVIERRIWAAASADFVVAFYNPRSRKRHWQLARAFEMLRAERPPQTPVAVVRNVTRPTERVHLTTLADVCPDDVDMFALVIVGNSQTRFVGPCMATPRGYLIEEPMPRAEPVSAMREARSPRTLYPLLLNTAHGVRAVVVGGGRVATRKVKGLLAAGVQVQVMSPAATSEIQQWAVEGRLVWVARSYREGDLTGADLVFAATNCREVNAAVAAEARACGVLCNVADVPEEGTFYVPAVLRRDDLLVAVSSGGRSPRTAARLRDAMADWLETNPLPSEDA